jgi:hypothetical protein
MSEGSPGTSCTGQQGAHDNATAIATTIARRAWMRTGRRVVSKEVARFPRAMRGIGGSARRGHARAHGWC